MGFYLPCSGMCILVRHMKYVISCLLLSCFQGLMSIATGQDRIYRVLKAEVGGKFGDSGAVSYSISLAWEKIEI